jgi:hypothetical protein
MSTTTIEADARAMSKQDRIAHLRDCGWHRVPGLQAPWEPPGERRLYTLAAAIREQLLRDRRAVLPHVGDIPVVPLKREVNLGRDPQSGEPVLCWVIDCPYCGREHTHGAEPGHRVSHCWHHGSDPGYIIEHPADDGEDDWLLAAEADHE